MTFSRTCYIARRSDHALFLEFRNLAVLVTEFPQHLDGVLRQDRRRTRKLRVHVHESVQSTENRSETTEQPLTSMRCPLY